MPARVHAILVVRPDGRAPAALHLKRTLAALQAQSRPVDALTIVACGDDPLIAERVVSSAAEAVLTAPASTSFAHAVRLASLRVAEGSAVWLLGQDTAPEPDALDRLAGRLELSSSAALAAPKLVRWDDRTQIVSLGESMTRLGRSVTLATGEFDQGQHDGDEDALGADIRGLLVRADAWRALGGVDPALAGADEGLDLGVRARLSGGRVALVPAARVAVAGDGAAGLPDPVDGGRIRRRAFAGRVAQLHRRLTYAHALALPFVWLSILPLAVLRTIGRLFAKAPGLIGSEWGAAVVAAVRLGSVASTRRRIAGHRTASWGQLAALRVTAADLRRRIAGPDDDPDDSRRGELRFLAGGGAWAVLGALLVSVGVFTALLAWPVLGGGGLLPQAPSPGELWSDAAWGARASGVDVVGPADGFAVVVALLGSLWPAAPSVAVVALWVLALPLAVLGGWFAATRLTDRASLRITGGVLWALAPAFLTALQQGRPAAVILHLLLPWLFWAGSIAHRSWSSAAAASLLLAGVVACAPSLAPALLVVWLIAIAVAISGRRGAGVARLLWLPVPAAALVGPLVWRQVASGDAGGLLADPGPVWLGPQVGADAAGRLQLAFGFPTSDPGGWSQLLGGAAAWWVPALLVPIAVLALVAPLTRRWAAGAVLLGVGAAGLATAFAAPGVAVAAAQATTVPLWPGTGLSLAWLGVAGAAVTTLDVGVAPRPAAVRPIATAVALLALAVVSFPMLTAQVRGQSLLVEGAESTLPAFVAAAGRDEPGIATLVLTPQNAEGLSARVVHGASETLGGQSTLVSTRREPTASDRRLAALAADLVASRTPDAVDALVRDGIGFVLLAPAPAPESDAARALRLQAGTAIGQRDALVSVGGTARGELWRVDAALAAPPGLTRADRSVAGWVTAAQLVVAGVALILAIPTPASRRAARRSSRIVGRRMEAAS